MSFLKFTLVLALATIFVGCERPVLTPDVPQETTTISPNAAGRSRGGGDKQVKNQGPVVIVVIEDTHFKPTND